MIKAVASVKDIVDKIALKIFQNFLVIHFRMNFLLSAHIFCYLDKNVLWKFVQSSKCPTIYLTTKNMLQFTKKKVVV